jgi:Protein of unknown function (DUF2911)
VVALLLAMTMTVQDSGAFVVRLGVDTLSLEQYRRTATQLRGEYVIRLPRSVHRIYTAELNPDGSIRRFELVTHNIGGEPGPRETKTTIDLTRDSAVVTSPRGDSAATAKIAVPKGTFPFQFYVIGLMEQMGRYARGTGKDSVRFSALPSATAPSGGYIKRRGSAASDTLVFMFDDGPFAGVGPFTFRMDRQGHITWLTGKGSTVQIDVQRVASVPMAQAGPMFANRPLGLLSPRDTARTTLAGADLWVDYGRPMKRGRVIFGDVVPWNTVWRTGANAATQFNTPVDLVIGGAKVPAGRYTLWTLPSQTGWKVIFNQQTGQWGTEYHEEQDLARVDAKVETLAAAVEQLFIGFEPAPGNASATTLTILWDMTKVSVPVSKQ